MVQKPTGKIGSIKVQAGFGKVNKVWDTANFPKSKEEIENFFCDKFVSEFKRNGATFYSVERNKENDFDFTLNLPGGKVYLDLVEIIIKKPGVKGSPYTEKDVVYGYQEYLSQVINLIKKKNEKYKTKSTVPIHLLLYFTHWKFAPNDNVIPLIQHDLKKEELSVENVFLYSLHAKDKGELRVLYPVEKDYLDGVDIVEFRKNIFMNLDPNGWKFEMK